MIKSSKPLSLAEARELVSKLPETEKTKNLILYIKKFTKLNAEDIKKIREELENIGITKMKGEHIAKIIDILPKDAEDVRKIFFDTNLNENEITQILDIVKRYI